ncbi:unnamed protein product [Choristocarpus tenellus]
MVAGVRKLAKQADWGSRDGTSSMSKAVLSYGDTEVEEANSKCMVVTTHIIMKAFRISINDRSNEPNGEGYDDSSVRS